MIIAAAFISFLTGVMVAFVLTNLMEDAEYSSDIEHFEKEIAQLKSEIIAKDRDLINQLDGARESYNNSLEHLRHQLNNSRTTAAKMECDLIHLKDLIEAKDRVIEQQNSHIITGRKRKPK